MINGLSSYLEVTGFVGALLTTIAFLPQVVRTWESGGDGLSYLMLGLLLTGTALWLLYGILLGSLPIVLANAVTALQVVIILALKLKGVQRRRELK